MQTELLQYKANAGTQTQIPYFADTDCIVAHHYFVNGACRNCGMTIEFCNANKIEREYDNASEASKIDYYSNRIRDLTWLQYDAGDTKDCEFCFGWGWKIDDVGNASSCEQCYETGQAWAYTSDFDRDEYEFM